jgi:hypothetical protein
VNDYESGFIPDEPMIFSNELRFAKTSDNKWVWRRNDKFSESMFFDSKKI